MSLLVLLTLPLLLLVKVLVLALVIEVIVSSPCSFAAPTYGNRVLY